MQGAEASGARNGAEGRRGASARHSLPSSLALGSSRSQPLAARLCSCAGSGAAAAFYRLPESPGRGGPGGPARWPMAARPPRPALGGARLTAPPPPASADWRPEQPRSRRGLAEGWSRAGRLARPNPPHPPGPGPALSSSERALPPSQDDASTPPRALLPPHPLLHPPTPHPQPVSPPRRLRMSAGTTPPGPFVPKRPPPSGRRSVSSQPRGRATVCGARLCVWRSARICVLEAGLGLSELSTDPTLSLLGSFGD